MRKITLFAMLLVGILAGRAQSAIVGTYDGSISPVHMNGAGEELTGKSVVISETDKGGINVTLPSFVLMTGMSTQEVTVEDVVVTYNEDGTCTLSSDSVVITPVNPMNPDMVMVPYKSTLTGVVGNGSIELAVAVPVQPGVIMTTATFKGAKKFELTSMNPQDGAKETTVYAVQMVFSKDITIELPEGGIDIVNNETQEVVKITRYYSDEWSPKNQATFQFEQVMVPGKDGKDELQDQYIETPGTYTCTIPAGVIKSVDGEEFPETTFSFTIIGTFSLASYSPSETTQLDKIELTFDKEIVEVGNVSGMCVADLYWSTFISLKEEVVISEDKKTVTLELETPITEVGKWFLDLSQGVFVSADGVNEYTSMSFEVIDPAPSFFTTYNDGDKVKELGSTFEITFKNVDEVKLVQETLSVYLPGSGEATGTATLVDNKIVVSFNQQFVEEGDYLFHIPAGMFTMDGVANEERQINVTLFSFAITPLEVISVTPQVGQVDKIEKIVVTFNQLVSPSYNEDWQMISREIKLTCGEQVYTLTYAPESWNLTNDVVYLVNAEWVDAEGKYVSTPITAEGTYTLNLADIVVDHAGEDIIDEWGYPSTVWHSKNQSCEGTYTWTIGEVDNAVDFVGAETGEQTIYDILGRRVEKVTEAGLYIVNGKKVVIK